MLAEIRGRGNIPLLAGGTMLYFKALQEGLSQLPPADPDTRLVIDTMAEDSGWPALHAELERIDPATAARLQPDRRAADPTRAGGLSTSPASRCRR